MAGAFTSGSSYINLSNVRCRVLCEAAIDVARDLATTELQIRSVDEFERWWKEDTFPGIDIELAKRFHEADEYKLWSQAFYSLGWRVFNRRWGNQDDDTWQVGFISSCDVISRMLTELVWKTERGWWPAPEDEDGIRPDPMRIQH